MSIITSEIIWREAEVMVDGSSNGGIMTPTAISTAVKNNLWPDVPQSERTAGSTKYRKVFIHIANDSDIPLVQPYIFIETNTPGDDAVIVFEGTQSDTEATLDDTRVYGCGPLDANVAASASTFDVSTEGVGFAMFQDGDLIRISDKTDVNDTAPAHHEEYHTISGAPSYTGDVATIVIVGTLAYGYNTADSARVSSVIEASDIEGSVSGYGISSASGTFDIVSTPYPIVVDHIAGVEETWTLTFKSGGVTFDLAGSNLGFINTYPISASLEPPNADYSNKPYFILDHTRFGGTFVADDTISFTTHPAAYPLWYKRVIPAAASSLSANKVIVAIDGQSA